MEERVNVTNCLCCQKACEKVMVEWTKEFMYNANARMQLVPNRPHKHEFANRTWIEYFVKLMGRIEISPSLIRLAESINPSTTVRLLICLSD